MKAHELANRLLQLSDKDVVIIKPAGGPYVEDFEILGFPWEDLLGSVRIQICSPKATAANIIPPLSGVRI